MNTSGPINLDSFPQYRDRDEDAEVFLAVYKPSLPTLTPRDLHWSLAWQIKGTAAWRQIHVLQEKMIDGPPPQPRYVYWGALTKSAGPTDSVATKHSLGIFSLADRQKIEDLAWKTPVMIPDGTWNCQDWLLDLLRRVTAAGLVSQEKVDSVLNAL
ncbi:hypothetical protein OH77DRAFT_1418213 [Trametes cingulata]|nr:hypothetical protein OH77DRAFT_1418213 [Trametes cingulata]